MVGGKCGVFRERLYYLLRNWSSQPHYALGYLPFLTAPSQLPQGHHHARKFPHQLFDGFALFPPALRIKIPITRAGDAHFDALWKNSPKNISRAARMII